MSTAVLERATFETSRELEYFTDKELTAQIGLDHEYWPVAILRELIDNSLDACETVGVLPEIEVTTENDCICISDNGPGLPRSTIEKSLNYMVRVSNKAYYVSPTRGQMGNALKVLWAAPFVSTGHGDFEIVSQGERHHIGITLDRIAQRPEIRHEVEPADGKTGTFVKVEWPNVTRLLREPEPDSYNSTPSAAELVAGFAAFNPHATFVLDGVSIDRTEPEWKKWSPDQPTSAHWYNAETLRDLIAAYIARERDGGPEKTVREFVAEFRGLSSTKKQKTVTEGWSGRRLHDFVVDGDVDQEFIVGLLNRMQAESSPVQPRLLGSVGKDHLTQWMVSQGVTEESIQYQRKQGIDELPFVLELAFGIFDDDDATRQIVTGLNWSSVIGGDPDPYLRNAISEARLDRHDPVMLVVHIARPRFQFADRGKTRLTL